MPPSDNRATKTITCGQHGEVPWFGTVLCSNCDLVYQTEDETAERYAPTICSCGMRLMPDLRANPRPKYTARIICQECYALGVARGGHLPFGSA
jgi:hypothetical protein